MEASTRASAAIAMAGCAGTSGPSSACTDAAYAVSAWPVPTIFAPLAASIQATVDPVAARDKPVCDMLAASIQACVQAMSTPLQGGCAVQVPMPRLPGGASVQPGLDAVATMVETALDDRGAAVEAMLDAIASPIEALPGTLALVRRHRGTGRQEQQGAAQGQGQDWSHWRISVCRHVPAGRRTPRDTTG